MSPFQHGVLESCRLLQQLPTFHRLLRSTIYNELEASVWHFGFEQVSGLLYPNYHGFKRIHRAAKIGCPVEYIHRASWQNRSEEADVSLHVDLGVSFADFNKTSSVACWIIDAKGVFLNDDVLNVT
jgi:hypothetical protein